MVAEGVRAPGSPVDPEADARGAAPGTTDVDISSQPAPKTGLSSAPQQGRFTGDNADYGRTCPTGGSMHLFPAVTASAPTPRWTPGTSRSPDRTSDRDRVAGTVLDLARSRCREAPVPGAPRLTRHRCRLPSSRHHQPGSTRRRRAGHRGDRRLSADTATDPRPPIRLR